MNFLFDPAVRGPIIGSFLVCLCASITGVLVFLRRRALVGETLSHAAYPGIVLGGFASYAFGDLLSPVLLLLCALFTSLLGYYLLRFIEEKGGIDPDSALCFVLAFSMGVGVLLASILQGESPTWYRKVQGFLYGQSVTLSDTHSIVYFVLTAGIILYVTLRFREIELVLFDETYIRTIGVPFKWIDALLMGLFALSIVVGIRSVGVILMSGMLIAPAVAARQLTHSFPKMLFFAALLSTVASIGGTVYAFTSTTLLASGARISLPPGPIILLFATAMAVLAMLFAPTGGLIVRMYRSMTFQFQCQKENLIKSIWKAGKDGMVDVHALKKYHSVSSWHYALLLWRLKREGWLHKKCRKDVQLTNDGVRKAVHIVRMHRLWEVYLVSHLGVSAKKVHRSAEEIEHILTPELEAELVGFVGGSTSDPHEKPIPRHGGAF